MTILADTTEERFLPDSLKSAEIGCKFISGLEDLVGADWIITPLSIPATNETLLLRHAEVGLCVQRKSISDFIQSFPDDDSRLWFQLARMQKITKLPWLLIVGDLKCDKEGKAVADGRTLGWDYDRIIAALEWWQIRGGYYTWLSREGLIADWCTLWNSRLTTRDENGNWTTKYISRPIGQTLYELPLISRTLMTLPGMGEERATTVYNYTEQRKKSQGDNSPVKLLECLIAIDEDKIDGIGKKTRERILHYVGWVDNEESE